MKNSLKSFCRPLVRRTISLIEPLAGFWTDSTSYLPNRISMLAGSYEKFLIQSICKVLPPNGVFVDVGANVGFISQQIARRFSGVKVLALEPNPRIYPILKKNLKAFPNCESLNVGLGAKEGNLEFFHGGESLVGSFIEEYTRRHPSNYQRGQIAKSTVRVTTGDSVLSQMRTIDVMKMDVEGYEIEVLRGMARFLADGAIKKIFFEFCPFAQRWAHNQPEEIIHRLIELGYNIYEVEGESAGLPVSAENVTAIIARLGDRGYTTLLASLQPISK
jgi:FkbM family methyltransferase